MRHTAAMGVKDNIHHKQLDNSAIFSVEGLKEMLQSFSIYRIGHTEAKILRGSTHTATTPMQIKPNPFQFNLSPIRMYLSPL